VLEKEHVGGLSIKGAAKAAAAGGQDNLHDQPRPSSLLDRVERDPLASRIHEGGRDPYGWKKNRRGMS
jgi:hypothetical protein